MQIIQYDSAANKNNIKFQSSLTKLGVHWNSAAAITEAHLKAATIKIVKNLKGKTKKDLDSWTFWELMQLLGAGEGVVRWDNLDFEIQIPIANGYQELEDGESFEFFLNGTQTAHTITLSALDSPLKASKVHVYERHSFVGSSNHRSKVGHLETLMIPFASFDEIRFNYGGRVIPVTPQEAKHIMNLTNEAITSSDTLANQIGAHKDHFIINVGLVESIEVDPSASLGSNDLIYLSEKLVAI